MAFLVMLPFSLASCAANTPTTQEQQKETQKQQKQVGWGTVDTIESEGTK